MGGILFGLVIVWGFTKVLTVVVYVGVMSIAYITSPLMLLPKKYQPIVVYPVMVGILFGLPQFLFWITRLFS